MSPSMRPPSLRETPQLRIARPTARTSTISSGAGGVPVDKNDVEILDRQTAYQGFYRLDRYRLRHRLHRGGWSRVIARENFDRGRAVAVLPYDPDNDTVVVVEQF